MNRGIGTTSNTQSDSSWYLHQMDKGDRVLSILSLRSPADVLLCHWSDVGDLFSTYIQGKSMIFNLKEMATQHDFEVQFQGKSQRNSDKCFASV